MVTKASLQSPRYNFLRRKSPKDSKQAKDAKDTEKTPSGRFSFGKPVVRASRKNPVER